MATKRKPNFLIVLIDDLRFDELGICGHPYMKTPHIDRLAKRGVLFTNAHCAAPLCNPSRAAIFSGGRDTCPCALPATVLALALSVTGVEGLAARMHFSRAGPGNGKRK